MGEGTNGVGIDAWVVGKEYWHRVATKPGMTYLGISRQSLLHVGARKRA